MAKKWLAMILVTLGACSQKYPQGNCVSSVTVAPAWHEVAKYATTGGFILTRSWVLAEDALAATKAPNLEEFHTAHFEFVKQPDGKFKVQVYANPDPFFSGVTKEFYAKVYWNGGYFDVPLRDPYAARRDAFRADAGALRPWVAVEMLDHQFDPYDSNLFWGEGGHGLPVQGELGKEWCSVDGKMASALRPAPGNRCLPFQASKMREFEVVSPLPLGIVQRLEELAAANAQKREKSRLDAASRELMNAWMNTHQTRNALGIEYRVHYLAAMFQKCKNPDLALQLFPTIEEHWSEFCADVETAQRVIGKHLLPGGASLATLSFDAYRAKEAEFKAAMVEHAGLYEKIMDMLQRDPSLLRLESNFTHSQIMAGAKPAFLSIPLQEKLPVIDGFFFEMDGRIPWFSIDSVKVPAAKEAEFDGTLLAVEGNYPFFAFESYEMKEETDGFASYVLPVSNNADDNRRAATVIARPNGTKPSTGTVTGVSPVSDVSAEDASVPRTVNCP